MTSPRLRPRLVLATLGGAAGLLAAALARGGGERGAAAVRPQPAPGGAVGGAAIDRTPRPLKEFAIRQFGERDKLVLLTGIVVVLAVFAVVVGIAARRRPLLGTAGIAVFGAVGAAAALTRPGAGAFDAAPSVAGAGAAALALHLLITRLSPTRPAGSEDRLAAPADVAVAGPGARAGVAGPSLRPSPAGAEWVEGSGRSWRAGTARAGPGSTGGGSW